MRDPVRRSTTFGRWLDGLRHSAARDGASRVRASADAEHRLQLARGRQRAARRDGGRDRALEPRPRAPGRHHRTPGPGAAARVENAAARRYSPAP